MDRLTERILVEHGLFTVPIDPVTLANRMGIKVHNAKFASDQLAGMIARRGENITLLVKHSDTPQRKRFTISHEIAHHFLHLTGDGEFVDTDRDLFRGAAPVEGEEMQKRWQEVEANRFAAALLMPERLVRQEVERLGEANASVLARRFNVSEEAMAIRLGQLGY